MVKALNSGACSPDSSPGQAVPLEVVTTFSLKLLMHVSSCLKLHKLSHKIFLKPMKPL